MGCCDTKLYDDQFDEAAARRPLRDYRRRGPGAWTARLIGALVEGGVEGLTVLDIGAVAGAVHQALLEGGALSATDVDASGPYLAASRSEAERRGLAGRVSHRRGDAVALAPEVPDADLVALDRVVCCYPDMPALVAAAAGHARRRLGIVLPRDEGWIRAGTRVANGLNALRRNSFRFQVHSTAEVLETARAAGLVERSRRRGRFWQLLVLERPGSA